MTPSWRVKVPASSANLGPGFDALGLALATHLTCDFRAAATTSISVSGRDAALIATDSSNLIHETAAAVASHAGETLPPVALHIHNEIPLGKGLGSSAAALVAGVVIANELLGLRWKPLRILDEAARIEGHPDNVAACVLGSIVASAIDSHGMTRAVRLELPDTLGTAVVVPDFPLPTHQARAVLPAVYSRADAVFNVQRSALLIAALATGTHSAFPAAIEDRLHQPYRQSLVPGLEDILKLRAPGLLGCCLSGAGPSVLVFFERGHDAVVEHVRQIFASHNHHAEVLASNVDRIGIEILELPHS
jgi:homoserine kinase